MTYIGTLRSESDNKYVGGGVMARFSDVCGTGLYLEATARMGRSTVNFGADGFLANASGDTKSVHYDLKGNYYSAHVGLGKNISLTDNISLDTSIKYLWAQQKGGSIEASGERLELSAVNSHRISAGGRVRYTYNIPVSVYGGAWVERELAGKSSVRSVATGKSYQGGSLKGTSLLGEIGIGFGDRSNKWLLDVGITGYTGKRNGIGGNAALSVQF